jgi:uncharacterized protein (UPF0264 family)
VAKLLVSVRSAVEAQAAVAGGAAIIDVKEPANGPLGRAPCSVWTAVRKVVPESIPVSVALGELTEWQSGKQPEIPRSAWFGLEFCKLGLSHAPVDWTDRWEDLRQWSSERTGPSLAWVAVVYTDWLAARAPDPDAVIRAATEVAECRGVLFDTWDKSARTRIDSTWNRRIAQVRESGRLVSLAGGIDAEAITRVASLDFDIIAVRGAACSGQDRCATIDRRLVAALAQAAALAGDHGPPGGVGLASRGAL